MYSIYGASVKTARCTACRRQIESENLPSVGEHCLVSFIPSDAMELRAESAADSAKTAPCVIALSLLLLACAYYLIQICGHSTLLRSEQCGRVSGAAPSSSAYS